MKKIIKTEKAPAPIGPYNQAVLAGKTLYVSGQIALNPETGELLKGSIEAETELVMRNLDAVLKAAGADFSHVVKSSIFVADMGQFARINEVYGAYFDADSAPARETVEVANLPKYVNVEISVIAYLGDSDR
ncbi:RidA family protein [Robiginitalea aurantiaca]|uniref:RidA family protein n=1 Tax=Robiginitalea aurantiaca TaxID=3056915 RepID=A0ABT7WI30_9FLAO|nr:RidA family protein [Robiginitalea aurantiaca]MDM9632578.1 RidA family protein [Robiginitalea aurantiaca]